MRVKRKNLLHQPQQKVLNDKGDSAWLSVENDIKHAVRCFLVLVSRGSTQSIGRSQSIERVLNKKKNKQTNKQTRHQEKRHCEGFLATVKNLCQI